MADFNDMTLDPVTGMYKKKDPVADNATGLQGFGSDIGGMQKYGNNTGIGTEQPQPYIPNEIPKTQGANTNTIGTGQAQPYVNENGNGYLPLVQNTNQGSQQVLQYAQNKVLNQAADPIAAKANQMTLEQMNNPNFGYNPQAFKSNQLSNFDLQRAQTAKQFQQTNADLGGSGEVQKNLLQTLLQSDVGRTNLENQLDMQAYQEQQKNYAAALAAGNTQQKLNSDINTAGIDNLVKVSGAGEGTANRTAAQESQAQAFQNDMQKLIVAQDWQGAQGNLDRAAAVAKQNNDINAQKAIQQQQLDFDRQKLEKTLDFEGNQAELERQMKVAMQTNDIETQKTLQERQIQADQIRLAKTQDWQGLQNDIDRQQAILSQSKTIESQQAIANMQITAQAAMQKNEQAFDAIQSELARAAEAAKNAGNITAQKEMQAAQIAAEDYRLGKTQDFTSVQSAYERAFQANQQDKALSSQMAITERQIEVDKWKLQKTQDFQGLQSELDRAQQTALQSNDINAQRAVQERQIAADSARLQSTQDWQGVQNDIERRQQIAMQANDIQSQRDIIEQQLALDKWKQENGQTFTAQQNELNRALESTLQSSKIAADKLNADLDRALQDQIASGQLGLNEKQLALQASQAKDEMTFKREALKNGNDQAAIDRAWQAGEAAKDRTQAKELQALDIKGQQTLMNLKATIDKNQLTQQETWQALQNDLDRKAEIALQKGDIAGQKEILAQKAVIDKQAAAENMKYLTAERIATQKWQSSERLSSQDFEKAAQYFDAATQKALQANDIAATKYLETQKNNLALKMQTNEMDQQTKMAYLNNKLQEATANNDVVRQKEIMKFSHIQELDTMAKELSNDQIRMQTQSKIDKMLQDGRFDDAMALQESQQEWSALEAGKDRAIEQFKLDLQKSGIQWDMLQQAIDNGQISPDAAVADLKQFMKDTGIKITPPDPLATQKEFDRQYQDNLYQFRLTHPELVNRLIIDKKTGKEADLFKDIPKPIIPVKPKKTAATINSEADKKYQNDLKLYNEQFSSWIETHNGDMPTPPQEPPLIPITEKQKAEEKAAEENYQVALKKYNEDFATYEKQLKPRSIDIDPKKYEFKNVLSPEGITTFNQFMNKTLYGELTPDEKAAKLVEGYLPQSDFNIASPGDKVNVTSTIKAANGASIPPGKYSIIENTEEHKSGGVLDGYTTTTRYAVKDDGTKIELSTSKVKNGQRSVLKTAFDPLNFFK